MKFYTVSAFCKSGKGPDVAISNDQSTYYPINISIKADIYEGQTIEIFMEDMADLIKFKNDVIAQFHQVQRKLGYER